MAQTQRCLLYVFFFFFFFYIYGGPYNQPFGDCAIYSENTVYAWFRCCFVFLALLTALLAGRGQLQAPKLESWDQLVRKESEH